MLQDRLGLSERRACRYVGQHRSTQRHDPVVAGDDGGLRAELRRISRRRPRWGYRRAHQLLLEEGWEINRKRTQRLWREEGLRVPQKRRKRQRLPGSTVPADRLRAQRPDHVWAVDFWWDQTADGHNLKLLHVVDEFTREALAIDCRRRIDAERTVTVLDRLVAERGSTPGFVRCDNGPEMTANALRDWCRFSGGRQRLYRAGVAVAEPLRRELRVPHPRRAAQRRAVLLPPRSTGPRRGLAPGLQPPPPALRARDDDPGRVRRQFPSATATATATAAGEEAEGRGRLTSTTQRPTRRIIPTVQRQNPAEDITPTPSQANSHTSYRGTTTPTQLSQQVER
jgi:putative transposase